MQETIEEYGCAKGIRIEAREVAQEALTRYKTQRVIEQDILGLGFLVNIKKVNQSAETSTTLDAHYRHIAALSRVEKEIADSRLAESVKRIILTELQATRSSIYHKTQGLIIEPLRVSMIAGTWPSKEDEHRQKEFNATFLAAIQLYDANAELPVVLNVFQAMTEHLQTRYRYHFTSKRETNRLDKPEWVLQHVVALAEQYEAFTTNLVQPLLQQAGQTRGLIASHEFIRALLPMVTVKIQENCAHLLNDTQLLTHTITETKRFDDLLRDNFGFCNRDRSYWKGVCDTIMDEKVFQSWLVAEEEFVTKRYHSIVEDVDVFEITPDFDETANFDIAPNTSALRMIDLFEAMTREFAALENLQQRQTFTLTIQTALLDRYRARIETSTDAFEALTGGFSGGFPTTDVAGTGGLQRLCRQYSGVSNVLAKLLDWSNEPYYVALASDDLCESCFQEQVAQYTALRMRIEGMIVRHLSRELCQDLRPYSRLRDWSSSESPIATVASTSTFSSLLLDFYGNITSMFSYLSSVASPIFIHRIYIALAQELDQLIYSSIIKKNEFSRRGALQLKRDMLQTWVTLSPYVARPEAGMRSVAEALIVLSDGKDEQEALILAKIEAALESAVSGRQAQAALLKSAGIFVLTPFEVRSLLQHKLYSVE